MARTPEGRLTDRIKKYLESQGWLVRKYHGSPYTRRGHPDLYGAMPGGRMFGLEVKRPGGKLTANQKAEIALWEAIGVEVGVVYGMEDVRAFCARNGAQKAPERREDEESQA